MSPGCPSGQTHKEPGGFRGRKGRDRIPPMGRRKTTGTYLFGLAVHPGGS